MGFIACLLLGVKFNTIIVTCQILTFNYLFDYLLYSVLTYLVNYYNIIILLIFKNHNVTLYKFLSLKFYKESRFTI